MLRVTSHAEIERRPLAMLGALLAKPAFRATAKLLDYREYGGAPLLGVNGVVIIGHGRSDALAIENAVGAAIEATKGGVVEAIHQDIQDALRVLAARRVLGSLSSAGANEAPDLSSAEQ